MPDVENYLLIFYPPNHVGINSSYKVKNVKNHLFCIPSLPLGIDEQSIFIDYPVKFWKYQYDLNQRNTLLRESIGKNIKCKIENNIKEYQLLAVNNSDIFLKKKRNLIIIPNDSSLIFSVNDDIASSPRLDIQFDPKNKIPNTLNITYLMDSIKSNISYIGVINNKKNNLELSCLLHVQNNSGLALESTNMEIHLGQLDFMNSPDSNQFEVARLLTQQHSQNSFIEDNANDIYIYKFNTPYILEKNAHLYIPIFSNMSFPVKKTYLFSPPQYLLNQTKISMPLEIEITFKNISQNPLPKGNIQFYADKMLIGKTTLPFSSKGKDISLIIGKASDVFAQKNKINSLKLSQVSQKDSFRITVSNYQTNAVQVKIKDVIFGNNWKMASSSIPYTKKSANEIQFDISIPANSNQEITYEVLKDSPHEIY